MLFGHGSTGGVVNQVGKLPFIGNASGVNMSFGSGNYPDAKSRGVDAQDLIHVAPAWKLLAGLRWDHFKGDDRTYATTASAAVPVIGAQTTERARRLPLEQALRRALPTDCDASFHFLYGTLFNTSGDTYQYVDQTKNTPPERSQNFELGAKIDAWLCRFAPHGHYMPRAARSVQLTMSARS